MVVLYQQNIEIQINDLCGWKLLTSASICRSNRGYLAKGGASGPILVFQNSNCAAFRPWHCALVGWRDASRRHYIGNFQTWRGQRRYLAMCDCARCRLYSYQCRRQTYLLPRGNNMKTHADKAHIRSDTSHVRKRIFLVKSDAV